MKTFCAVNAALVGFASFGAAHMEMKYPPPIRSQFNKFTTDIDYDMTSPLDASGSNFPCKGYHTLVGAAQGQSVVTWTPGQSYNMTITGGAAHNGGSCQASLSFDGGSTWNVIHSYIGNCPLNGESTLDFALPNDVPTGAALFAWSWFNQVGNREMYMNCASISIAGSAQKFRKARGVSDSIKNRPAMFVANVGNGCATIEGQDLLFPQPGPDVDMNSQNTVGPSGTCPSISGSSSSSSSSSSFSSGSSTSTSSGTASAVATSTAVSASTSTWSPSPADPVAAPTGTTDDESAAPTVTTDGGAVPTATGTKTDAPADTTTGTGPIGKPAPTKSTGGGRKGGSCRLHRGN